KAEEERLSEQLHSVAVALLEHRRKAEVADGEVEPERILELAGDRARFLELADRVVVVAAQKAVPADVVQAVRRRHEVAGLALERQDLLRGGTPGSGPAAMLTRGERKEDLRALPRVGACRQK